MAKKKIGTIPYGKKKVDIYAAKSSRGNREIFFGKIRESSTSRRKGGKSKKTKKRKK